MTPHLGMIIWLGFGSLDYFGSLNRDIYIYFKQMILYSCFHDGFEQNYVCAILNYWWQNSKTSV